MMVRTNLLTIQMPSNKECLLLIGRLPFLGGTPFLDNPICMQDHIFASTIPLFLPNSTKPSSVYAKLKASPYFFALPHTHRHGPRHPSLADHPSQIYSASSMFRFQQYHHQPLLTVVVTHYQPFLTMITYITIIYHHELSFNHQPSLLSIINQHQPSLPAIMNHHQPPLLTNPHHPVPSCSYQLILCLAFRLQCSA